MIAGIKNNKTLKSNKSVKLNFISTRFLDCEIKLKDKKEVKCL